MNAAQAKGDEKGEKKEVTIVVNAQKKTVAKGELSFTEIVNLAFNNNPPTGPNIVITVTYSRGEGDKKGSLVEGQSVKVKEGMIFDVTATDRS